MPSNSRNIIHMLKLSILSHLNLGYYYYRQSRLVLPHLAVEAAQSLVGLYRRLLQSWLN